MKKSDFMRTELIGMEVEVLSAPCYAWMAGRVVDETKNTFTVATARSERMVPKKGNQFKFMHHNEEFVIAGSEILHRPEDRIKKVR